MNETKQWYGMYVRHGRQKKIAEILSRKKIEHFCPLTFQQSSQRKKSSQESVFTSYVFVRMCEREIGDLKQIAGVISFLFWLGKPAAIPDCEIETIRQFLNQYQKVKAVRSDVHVSATTLSSPSFESTETSGLELKMITAKLPSLGYSLIAEERPPLEKQSHSSSFLMAWKPGLNKTVARRILEIMHLA